MAATLEELQQREPKPQRDRAILEDLAQYARELEVALYGDDTGEEERLVAANARLADLDELVLAEMELGGTCPDNTETPGGPHLSSPSLCVFCMEYQ